MKKDQKQVQARVLKKLSALRATLSNDERAVLDSLIVVDQEVRAHRMTGRTTSKTTTKTQDKTTPKSVEVEAHRMTGRTTSKTTPKTQDKTTPKSVEVEAHRMTGRTTSKTTTKTPPPALQIAFDQDSEEYKVTE